MLAPLPTEIQLPAGQERLTWEEICARYPEEWVVLVDLDWINEDGDFRTAVVLGHGKGRDASLCETRPTARGYQEYAHEYTGPVRAVLPSVNMIFWRA